jgi:hypothetical protein
MASGGGKACKGLWDLENLIGTCVGAQFHIDVACRRIRSQLKTVNEKYALDELKQARADIDELKALLAEFHPSALKRKAR